VVDVEEEEEALGARPAAFDSSLSRGDGGGYAVFGGVVEHGIE
jgi:hypothetical protein